ncbi:hypothetical protein [Bradyrhizobium sp. SZCCHNRI20481]|uniref:hypothetical protein n=1 Tax=Bradyrhizobium sp. SZCCHNRI20481 TaxID=3057286 RepID=UPI002916E566|nr:hypothetical protein [Bradyrhizobium sp. SZCCHNRI20481]
MSSLLRSSGSRITVGDAQSERWRPAKPAALSNSLAHATSAPDEDAAIDLSRPWWQTASAVDDAPMPMAPAEADRSWQIPSLDPVVMPPPPPERLEFDSVFRFGAAVAALACLAFFAVRIMQAPNIETVTKSEATASSSPRNFGTAGKSKSDDGQASLDAAAHTIGRADSIMASIPIVKPAPGGGETPQSIPPKASRTIATRSPAPAAASALTKNEISEMLKRGRDLIGAGDVASARLILAHVAEADAEASLTLAGTYDPAILSNLKAVGVAPDPAKARAWYARAAELGSLEARRRLE